MSEEKQMAEVLAAVAKAAKQVKTVAKDGKNEHDKYGFASIDAFLEMVRPICAEAGLIIAMDEMEIEDFTRKGKYGDSSWMRMKWGITVYHISGQSMPTAVRTVEVLRNGAQAYGSAQSYALKQFLRALLQIATGDKDDADLQAKDDAPVEREVQRQQTAQKTAPFDPVAKADAMIGALRSKGLHMKDHPAFADGLAQVRAASPEQAARIEAEVETLTRNADLGGDGIAY